MSLPASQAKPAFEPKGVYAASLTPMTDRLEPDIPRLIAHSRWLLAHGCDGLGIMGTTGEANSLSFADRRRIIEATAAALPKERLMPGIGSCSFADAVELARAALASGTRNLLCLPPFYYKGVPDAGVEAFFANVIDRVGSADLRLYLYNFPQLTGYSFPIAMVERLRKRFGDVVAGMKDSSGDFKNMASFAKALPGFRVFSGTEQYLLDIVEAGGVGCISATANLTAPWCQAVLAAKGDARRAAQETLSKLRLAIQAKPLIPGIKGLMARLTGDARWLAMCPPYLPLAVEEIDAMAEALAGLGLKTVDLAA